MKLILGILASLAAASAQTPSYGSTARSGAVIDNRNASQVFPDRQLTSEPATCVTGERYYNATTQKSRRCVATNTWSDDGGASAPLFDPLDTTVAYWREEFQTGSGASPGVARWISTAIASGAQSFAAGEAEHPGIFTVTAHATNANSGADLSFISTVGAASFFPSAGWLGHDWEYRVIFKLGSTSNARVRIGISGFAGGVVPSAGGMWLRYDTDVTYADNTKNGGLGSWVAQLCNSTSGCGEAQGSKVDMGLAPDTAWHTFRIFRSGGTISMQIDGNAPKTFCASGCSGTVPSAYSSGYSPGASLCFSTGGALTHALDFAAFKISGLAR